VFLITILKIQNCDEVGGWVQQALSEREVRRESETGNATETKQSRGKVNVIG
jgi:hypothetical protein